MCINPKSRTCDCDACLDERIHVSGMRNRALYNGYMNPLAQWLASEEWTEIHDSATKSKRGTWFTPNDVYWGNEVSGEING